MFSKLNLGYNKLTMPEGSIAVENTEKPQNPPVEIKYEGDINPISPPIRIDGALISKAVEESNYPHSVARPITIKNSSESAKMAHFNHITGNVTINQRAIVNSLKEVRKREYKYLESEQMEPGRLKKFLMLAGALINPVTAPYALLGNREMHTLSGNKTRRQKYLEAAKAGFNTGRSGQLSKEESIARAKDLMDKLIEKSAPFMIGWTIAHEYEHGHFGKEKLGLKLSSMIAPIFGGATLASVLSSPESSQAAFAAGLFLGHVGGTLTRMIDEKDSYNAGDKNFAKFAKAIQIDHDFFQKEVLGKASPSTQAA